MQSIGADGFIDVRGAHGGTGVTAMLPIRTHIHWRHWHLHNHLGEDIDGSTVLIAANKPPMQPKSFGSLTDTSLSRGALLRNVSEMLLEVPPCGHTMSESFDAMKLRECGG